MAITFGSLNFNGPAVNEQALNPSLGLKSGGTVISSAPSGTTNQSLFGATATPTYQAPAAPTVYNLPGGGTTTSYAAYQQAAQQQADTSAYWQDQLNTLNGQLPRLDDQQNVGLQNIGDSYNNGLNKLNTQKGRAEQSYNLQVDTNGQQYGRNRSAIQTQTANRANALQRLLGIAGSGNSSAANDAVPYAAGIQGTQQLDDAQNAYAVNGRNLDMNWQNTLGAYNDNVGDLGQQKYAQENGLKQSIAQTRAGLLDQIKSAGVNKGLASGQSYQQALNAESGYTNQINSLLNSIAGLGAQYQNRVAPKGDVNFAVPTLSQYSLKQGAAPTMQNQNPGTSDVNPIFAPLLNQNKDEFGNPIS